MIYVQNTPNNAGVAIYGDFQDFEKLYDALHTIVGDEGDFMAYENARLRVLGVCYDLRHSMMGNREIEFVDNGIQREMMKAKSMIIPDKNVYFKIHVYWPEMLFVTMVLNDFVKLYAKQLAKVKFDFELYEQPKLIWDSSIAQVRLLQSAVNECIKETVTEHTFTRLLNMMNKRSLSFYGYITQYLDILNIKFLQMNNEKRLKSISLMTKRIVEQDNEYRSLKTDLMHEARKRDCSVSDLRLNIDYPEEIDW